MAAQGLRLRPGVKKKRDSPRRRGERGVDKERLGKPANEHIKFQISNPRRFETGKDLKFEIVGISFSVALRVSTLFFLEI